MATILVNRMQFYRCLASYEIRFIMSSFCIILRGNCDVSELQREFTEHDFVIWLIKDLYHTNLIILGRICYCVQKVENIFTL